MVVALLLRRQLLDFVRIEGCLADVVRQALAGHQVALAHFVAPPPSRMRGSSIASSTSETKTPITTSIASNIMKTPARYISWLCRARNSSGPLVGRSLTMEPSSEPATMTGWLMPKLDLT